MMNPVQAVQAMMCQWDKCALNTTNNYYYPALGEFTMRIIKRGLQTAALSALAVSFNVYADSWNCSHSDLVREVIIEYPEGGSVPCNVVYKKHTEGVEDQVLWSALNEEGYCEEKAREFVVKLESWGWVCLETVSSDVTADVMTEHAEDEHPDAGAEAGGDAGTE